MTKYAENMPPRIYAWRGPFGMHGWTDWSADCFKYCQYIHLTPYLAMEQRAIAAERENAELRRASAAPAPDSCLVPREFVGMRLLTEAEIDAWQEFLQKTVGTPPGCNVLCRMAKAAFRLLPKELK